MRARSDDAPSRETLAALVLGHEAAWQTCAAFAPDALVRQAETHGMVPLLAEASRSAGAACPVELGARLHREVTEHLARDLVREQELRRVIEAFDAAGVRAVLMKGGDLAYGYYERPDLRPRTDSDLLIAEQSRAMAAATLRSLGYERVAQTGGRLLMYQEPFRMVRDAAVTHVVDLHWRLFNPQRYGAVLPFADLDARAEARPRLSPAARGLDPVHAMLLACVHRIAHHFDHDRLIWLYDIKVLAGRLQPAGWDRLLELAGERSIRDACWRTLSEGRRVWDAAVPASVLASLATGDRLGADRDPFLDPRAPHARRVLSDFQHVGGWRQRLALARQHLFPPARYMRTIYAPSSTAPLWVLYLGRVLRGSRRWLVRS